MHVWMGLLLFGEGSCVYNEPDWAETMADRSDVLQHSTGLRSTRTRQQRQKCQCTRNTNATRSVTSGNESVWLVNLGRAAGVGESLSFAFSRWLRLLGSICHGVKWDVRDPGQTAVHYWVWFRVLERHSRRDKFSRHRQRGALSWRRSIKRARLTAGLVVADKSPGL